MTPAHLKRGWCPTLEKPMETGDGLLVRFIPRGGMLSAAAARSIAALSRAHGNGLIDLTRFGNLQLRGVTEQSYGALHGALIALGMEAPERPAADRAVPQGAVGFGIPFGHMEATTLLGVADIAEQFGSGMLFLGKAREMFVLETTGAESVLQAAEALGLVTCADDARRMMHACPGAPACARAEGPTRALATAIAAALPGLEQKVHVSGCAKGCACPVATGAVVTARGGAYDVAFAAKAGGAAALQSLTAEAVIGALAEWERA